MASRFKAYKIGADLDDAADIIAKENGYPSSAAFVKGLIRYAVLCRSKHHVTLPWAQLPLTDQDKLDAALLRRAQEGRGMSAKQAATVNWQDL
ncbi:MAG TPA: hypothetical protein VGE29_08670 [Prosthecobacter sp.]